MCWATRGSPELSQTGRHGQPPRTHLVELPRGQPRFEFKGAKQEHEIPDMQPHAKIFSTLLTYSFVHSFYLCDEMLITLNGMESDT